MHSHASESHLSLVREFAESVLRNANEAYERRTEIQAKGLGLDQLIMIVAKYLDLDADLIVRKGRKRSIARARSIGCALAVDRLMFSNTDIALRARARITSQNYRSGLDQL